MTQSHRPAVDAEALLPRTAVSPDAGPGTKDDRIELLLGRNAATPPALRAGGAR